MSLYLSIASSMHAMFHLNALSVLLFILLCSLLENLQTLLPDGCMDGQARRGHDDNIVIGHFVPGGQHERVCLLWL